MKIKCLLCPRIAVWLYITGRDVGNDFYCAEHLYRGCSCTSDENGNFLIDSNDEQGRAQPCCEYMFDRTGFDEEPESIVDEEDI